MKRLLASLLTAGSLLVFPCYANAAVKVPLDIYQWVQSTARSTYYFNKQSMCYGLDRKGFIDLNILLVPAVKTYDGVQKEDVISKRRWKNLPVDNYNKLAAGAFYLSFNINDRTVQIIKRVDLDENWGELGNDTSGSPIKLDNLSGKDVEGIFYRSILKYASEHQAELLKHTNGKLSKEGEANLEASRMAMESVAQVSSKKNPADKESQQEEQPQKIEQSHQQEQPKPSDQLQQKDQPKQAEQPQPKEQVQNKEPSQQREQPQQKEPPKQIEQNQQPQQNQLPPCCQNCPCCQQFLKNNGK